MDVFGRGHPRVIGRRPGNGVIGPPRPRFTAIRGEHVDDRRRAHTEIHVAAAEIIESPCAGAREGEPEPAAERPENVKRSEQTEDERE